MCVNDPFVIRSNWIVTCTLRLCGPGVEGYVKNPKSKVSQIAHVGRPWKARPYVDGVDRQSIDDLQPCLSGSAGACIHKRAQGCPLSGLKQKWPENAAASPFDPKQT